MRPFYGDWTIVATTAKSNGISIRHPAALPSGGQGHGAETGGGIEAPSIELVPAGDATLPRADFDAIEMGCPVDDLRAAVRRAGRGEPFHHGGPADGRRTEVLVDGYHLDLWYYGRAVISSGERARLGRSIYTTAPTRVH